MPPTIIHDDAAEELLSQVVTMGGIDVAERATSGLGTAASPFAGWDTITPVAHGTYVFRPNQYYRCSSVVNWAKTGLTVIGNNARIMCTGSGYFSVEEATGTGIVTDINISGLILHGDGATTPCCLKIAGVTDSYFGNIMIGDCITVGCDLKFVLTTTFFRVRVSINPGYYSVMPTDGFILDQRGSGDDCIANKFIMCNPEGVSGKGYSIVKGSTNRFIGGASQANGYGFHSVVSTSNRNNTVESVHMEANSIADIYCLSSLTTFKNISSVGVVKIGDGGTLADMCTIQSGRYAGAVTISGNNNVIHSDVDFTGTLTDNSSTTRYVGDLTPLFQTVQTSGNAGFGAAPSATAGQVVTATSNGDVNTVVAISNSDATSINSRATVDVTASAASGRWQAHGSGRTLTRWGQALGGYAELVASAGNGLSIGTSHAAPLRMGTAGQTRTFVTGTSKALTESVATGIADVSIPNNEIVGGTLFYTVDATDGTEYQSRAGSVHFVAVSKAGTITSAAGTPVEIVAVSSGTLTVAFSITNGAAKITLNLDAVSSLAQTTLRANFRVQLDGGTGNVTPL